MAEEYFDRDSYEDTEEISFDEFIHEQLQSPAALLNIYLTREI